MAPVSSGLAHPAAANRRSRAPSRRGWPRPADPGRPPRTRCVPSAEGRRARWTWRKAYRNLARVATVFLRLSRLPRAGWAAAARGLGRRVCGAPSGAAPPGCAVWRIFGAAVMIGCYGRRVPSVVHSYLRPHRPEAQDVALSRPKHGFESRWGRQIFFRPFIGLQVPEKRRGYRGSIESISVVRDSLGEKQLLQSLAVVE